MKLRPLAVIAACCALVSVWGRAHFTPAPSAKPPETAPRAAVADRRAPDNTFLTFPEWYLVYSPDEYAEFIADQPPSEFPFLGHVGQMWQSYFAIHEATKDDYPFNADYHTMILVIATSTSIEYGLKWCYETMVGRLTEATCAPGTTREDRLAARTAREYVAFLDVEPWYKFDFLDPLRRLWTETDFWGPDPIRSWERKYYLTSDYLAKAGYAWVIKQGSESSYGIESQVTAVVLDHFPEADRKELPEIKIVSEAGDGSVLAYVPRYQAFTKQARALAQRNINFGEIAGNRGPIVVSAIVFADDPATNLKVVFTQPILTRPSYKRIVFMASVTNLSAMLRKLDRTGVRIEHIYDY
jgi:hypothetical protein